MYEEQNTTTVTIKVTATTSWVLRRILHSRHVEDRRFGALDRQVVLIGGGAAILLQLIMQGFQANAENLSGAGLIVAGGLQGLQNQQLLGFFHSRAHVQVNGI